MSPRFFLALIWVLAQVITTKDQHQKGEGSRFQNWNFSLPGIRTKDHWVITAYKFRHLTGTCHTPLAMCKCLQFQRLRARQRKLTILQLLILQMIQFSDAMIVYWTVSFYFHSPWFGNNMIVYFGAGELGAHYITISIRELHGQPSPAKSYG